MKAKKVLFFGKLPPPYVGENVISKSILSLLENSFDVTIINSSGVIEKKESVFRKIIYFSNQAFHLLKCFIQLRRKLKKEKFQFVYFSGSSSVFGSLSDSLLLLISRKYVDSIICHLHRSNYKNNFTERRLYSAGKFLVNNIDKFVFSSKNLSEDLKNYIPECKREYLFNPIDESVLLSDEEFEKKHQLIKFKQKYIVTYLSNFILTKGYMDLVEAIKLLPEKVKKEIIVRFIGEWIDSDNKKNNFFTEINSKELAPVIEYIGPIRDRVRIKELLIQSDIFCLPSYYPVEAQPVSIIEAMNAGNAIISTFHASIPEYVDDQKLGILVEKRNTKELANAIQHLCNSEILCAFSINARKKFLDNFSNAVIAKKLTYIFS